MTDSKRPRPTGNEREIPPPPGNPGMRAVDDHGVGGAAGTAAGTHQPTEGLDEGVGTEHLESAAQGIRPEETPGFEDIGAEATGGGPDGEEESGRGPAFEVDR